MAGFASLSIMLGVSLVMPFQAAGQSQDFDAASPCRRAIAVMPSRVCSAAGRSVAIANSSQRAEELAAIMASAATKFERYFLSSPPGIAVLEAGQPSSAEEPSSGLKAAGFAKVLPWLSRKAFQEQYEASVRRGIEAKLKLANMSLAAVEGLVKQAVAGARERFSDEGLARQEAGTLPHELGHLWFVVKFWPGSAVTSGDHYGGPAPDWMDETAAVLLEDDALGDRRRDAFRAVVADASASSRAEHLLELREFLTKEHPLSTAAFAGRPAASGPTIRVLTGDEAKAMAGTAEDFYLTTRMFADYLEARSDATVFAAIGAAFARGDSFEIWLTREGPGRHLPKTLTDLQTDWKNWVASQMRTRSYGNVVRSSRGGVTS